MLFLLPTRRHGSGEQWVSLDEPILLFSSDYRLDLLSDGLDRIEVDLMPWMDRGYLRREVGTRQSEWTWLIRLAVELSKRIKQLVSHIYILNNVCGQLT